MALFGMKKQAPRAGAPAGPTTGVLTPAPGALVPLAEVADPVFSQGVMGPGAAVLPTGTEVHAPVAGTVVTVFPTGHAYGLRTADGVEVLVHVGLDTVELAGRGFAPRVAAGATVAAGDLLGTFDPEVLRAAGKDLTTVVVVTALPGDGTVATATAGRLQPGDVLLHLHRQA